VIPQRPRTGLCTHSNTERVALATPVPAAPVPSG
jgi:hypothetical protein